MGVGAADDRVAAPRRPGASRPLILHVVESLGSGVTTALEDHLRSAPEYVHVVLGWLAAADVYVHTAAWEGAPISVLEAVALGLPVVARRNPALAALDLPMLCDTPEELIEAIRGLLDERRRAQVREHGERLLRQHRPEAQRAALERVYQGVLRAGARGA